MNNVCDCFSHLTSALHQWLHLFRNTDNYNPNQELKDRPGPSPQLGCHPLFWRYSRPGKLSDIAINLSRAKLSIKLFGMWQLLKGQRRIKHSFTRRKISSLPHNLLSFNTQDMPYSRTYTHRHTHTHLCNIVSTLHWLVWTHHSTLCINRKHALSLLNAHPFTAQVDTYVHKLATTRIVPLFLVIFSFFKEWQNSQQEVYCVSWERWSAAHQKACSSSHSL